MAKSHRRRSSRKGRGVMKSIQKTADKTLALY